jgi:uncharacterized protein (TIGR03067 family)
MTVRGKSCGSTKSAEPGGTAGGGLVGRIQVRRSQQAAAAELHFRHNCLLFGGDMPITKLLLSVAILTFSTAALVADPPKADDKDDVKKLQGTWQATTWIDHGMQPGPEDEVKEFRLKFKDNSVIFGRRKGVEDQGQKYTLDPSKQPKWIDIDMGEKPLGLGIYKIEGDDLTICVVGSTNSGKPSPRPSEFKAKKDQHTLLVLKRVKT